MDTLGLVRGVVVFALGTVLGSFLNVVIYRLPRGESIIVPGSHCPTCGTLIRAYDNVPIISFLLLRGRCRACEAPIGWRYPLVEVAAGALLLAVWSRHGSWVALAADAIFVLLLLAIFVIDLRHAIVPNALTYTGLAAGLIFAAARGRGPDALLAAAGAGALFLLIAVVSRGGMGGGDVKLAAMMGAFLGWPAIVVALFAAFTLGAGAGLALIAAGRRTRKDPIPFGPALAAGGIIALFFSPPLVAWYLR